MNVSNASDSWLHSCSDHLPPLSEDYFMNISIVQKALVGVCAILVLINVIQYLEQIYYVLNRYQTTMAVKYRTLEILGIYPAVSLTSLTALCIPRASIFCHLANAIYISVCVYNFAWLMLLYFGGNEQLFWQLKGETMATRQPPCCCCCFCLPNLAVSVRNVRRLKALLFQHVVVQSVIAFVSLVLWTEGKFSHGQGSGLFDLLFTIVNCLGTFNLSQDNAFLYLQAITAISSMVALYGLFVVFKLCKGQLRSTHLVAKFAALKLAIIFCLMQEGLFSILSKFKLPVCLGILSTEVRGKEILNMMLVFEMFLLSLLARWLYRRPHDITSNLPSHQKETETVSPGNYVTEKIESPSSVVNAHTVASTDSQI